VKNSFNAVYAILRASNRSAPPKCRSQEEVHAGFYEKLLKAYPDLSQNELKLCAFLRLNMSTKDIAELTGQQLPSIDKARYRLRKKLGLASSETNLVTFLSQV
jgi:DNA-binding CsgD family transcriptional regulator